MATSCLLPPLNQTTPGCGPVIPGPWSSPWPRLPQHVVQPVICTQPSYRGPVLQNILAGKPRSPPDSAGSSATLDSPPASEKCSTPYRLPRISPRGTPCTDDSPVPPDTEEKVWGRYGYEDNVRMPELGPNVHKAFMNSASPASSASQSVSAVHRHRHRSMAVPKFRNAAITPSVTAVHVIRDVDDASVHVYKNLLEKAANREQPFNTPAPTPTARSRSVSPAKSTKSIHWTLGNNRHFLFDHKGRSRKQGPYSREFTVRCMAPASWMRMKWGRQRTMVH